MDIDPKELEDDIAAAETAGAHNATVKLNEIGLEAWRLDQEITLIEQEAKGKKRELTKLLEHELPEALAILGLSEFGFETPSGTRARIMTETKVRGSLRNAEDQEAAIAYLEASGFEGAVKTNVSIDLTEEEREGLDDICSDINGVTGKYPNVVRNINPQTLMAFGRDRLKQDATWDYERVGLTAFTATKFTAR